MSARSIRSCRGVLPPAYRCAGAVKRVIPGAVWARPAGRLPLAFGGSVSRATPTEGEAMATPRSAAQVILADDNREPRERIVSMLCKAYWMEIETVMSYIANSINPDGVRAQEIVESLREDIQEELGHAQRFAERIKELYGVVP